MNEVREAIMEDRFPQLLIDFFAKYYKKRSAFPYVFCFLLCQLSRFDGVPCALKLTASSSFQNLGSRRVKFCERRFEKRDTFEGH